MRVTGNSAVLQSNLFSSLSAITLLPRHGCANHANDGDQITPSFSVYRVNLMNSPRHSATLILASKRACCTLIGSFRCILHSTSCWTGTFCKSRLHCLLNASVKCRTCRVGSEMACSNLTQRIVQLHSRRAASRSQGAPSAPRRHAGFQSSEIRNPQTPDSKSHLARFCRQSAAPKTICLRKLQKKGTSKNPKIRKRHSLH